MSEISDVTGCLAMLMDHFFYQLTDRIGEV